MARPRRSQAELPSADSAVSVPRTNQGTYESLLEALGRRRMRIDALDRELTTLTTSLDQFERQWHARMATLVTEYSRVCEAVAVAQSKLAAVIRTLEPEDEEDLRLILEEVSLEADVDLEDFDDQVRRFATHQQQASEPAFKNEDPAVPEQLPDAAVRAEVRRLYRDLAKRAHPDLAADPEDRARREALMQRINEAYAAHDRSMLASLMQETESAAPGFNERPLEERLRWARSELARLDIEIERLRDTIAKHQQGPMFAQLERFLAGDPVLDEHEVHYELRLQEETRRLERLENALANLDSGDAPDAA